MSEAAAKGAQPNTDRIVLLNRERGELLIKLRGLDKTALDIERERERTDGRLRLVEAALEGVDIATAAIREQQTLPKDDNP